ncbi:hypothetical protein D3C72_2136010 [compost metagenome]
MSMKSRGSFIKGPKYGSSRSVRAPKNSMSLPMSLVPISRLLRSVMARMGAEPVPVQIMIRFARG